MKFNINDRVKIKGKTNRVGTIICQLKEPIIIHYENKSPEIYADKGEWGIRIDNNSEGSVSYFKTECLEIVE